MPKRQLLGNAAQGDADLVLGGPASVAAIQNHERNPRRSRGATDGKPRATATEPRPATRIATLWITEQQIAGLAKLVAMGKYLTKSEAIRTAITHLLEAECPLWWVGP